MFVDLRAAVRRVHWSVWCLAGLIAVWALVFGRLAALRHDRFGTFGFDLAIHDQAVWLMAHGREPFLTVRGLDAFGHHFTPIYWLFAPAYWLGAGPKFLLAVQVGSQCLVAIALYRLTTDLLGAAKRWIGVAVVFSYFLHPTSGWLVWEFFHPDVLGLGPLLMAYRAARSERWRAFAVWALIAVGCKEDMFVAIAVIALVVITPRNRRRGLAVLTVSVIGYFVAARLIVQWRTGAPPFYEAFYAPYGDSPISVATHFLTHPNVAWRVFTDSDRLGYYRAMFFPVGVMLPLLGWRGMLVGVPMLFGNIATGPVYPHTFNYRFHYSAVVLAAIFIGVVESLASLRQWGLRHSIGTAKLRRVEVAFVTVLVACSVGGYVHWGIGPGSRQYRGGSWPVTDGETTFAVITANIDVGRYSSVRAMERAMRLIPPAAATTAQYNIIAHLAHRERVYEWPNPWIPTNWGHSGERPQPARNVQYIVLQRSVFGDAERSDGQRAELELFLELTRTEFEIMFDVDGVVVAKRVRPASCLELSASTADVVKSQYKPKQNSASEGSVTMCPTLSVG